MLWTVTHESQSVTPSLRLKLARSWHRIVRTTKKRLKRTDTDGGVYSSEGVAWCGGARARGVHVVALFRPFIVVSRRMRRCGVAE